MLGQENAQNPGVLVEENGCEQKFLHPPSLSEAGYHRHPESGENRKKLITTRENFQLAVEDIICKKHFWRNIERASYVHRNHKQTISKTTNIIWWN